MNAFDENHIRLGLVLRNEYPAWYFYREKSRAIRSILVPQERIAERVFAKHIVPARGYHPRGDPFGGPAATGCFGAKRRRMVLLRYNLYDVHPTPQPDSPRRLPRSSPRTPRQLGRFGFR